MFDVFNLTVLLISIVVLGTGYKWVCRHLSIVVEEKIIIIKSKFYCNISLPLISLILHIYEVHLIPLRNYKVCGSQEKIEHRNIVAKKKMIFVSILLFCF
jgi:hypothetical protein